MPSSLSRRLVPALLGSACAAVMASTASAAPGGAGASCGHPGMLTITGHGESRVAPDQVLISLGVTTQADTADQAMQDNSERQQAVLDTLASAGVDQSDIQTSGLTLNPMMNYPEDGTAPSIDGYMAQNLLTVRVTEIDRAGEVLDSIVDAGANEMQGIRFVREDSQTTEDEALRMAVEDATHRAGVMADAAGAELGRIMRMGEPRQEIAAPGPLAMRAMDAAGAQANSIPVEGGEVAFTADVEVTFSLAGNPADCAGGKKPGDDGSEKRDRDGHGDDRDPEMTGNEPRDAMAPGADAPADAAGMGGTSPETDLPDAQSTETEMPQDDAPPPSAQDAETGPAEGDPVLPRPEDIMPLPDASAGQSADAGTAPETDADGGTEGAQPAQN